jgi:hypothetical protein
MRYFKLRLTKPDGEVLFETDVVAKYFDLFVRLLVSHLVQGKVFKAGEQYDTRLIPRIDNGPDFEKPKVVSGKDIKDDGKGYIDISFEGINPPLERVKYLTLQLRSAMTGAAFRFDYRLPDFMADLLRNSTMVLLNEGTLQEEELFKIEVSAHDRGRARVDPEVVERTTTDGPCAHSPKKKGTKSGLPDAAIVPDKSAIDVSKLPEPQEGEEDLNIVIESVEELIKPQPGLLADFFKNAEPQGDAAGSPLPIFIRRGALAKTHKAGDVSLESDEEVGGFLVGNIYRDQQTEQLFVEISQIIEAEKAQGTYVSLNFNYHAWRQVLDRIDKEFPHQVTVGWYHTHLISSAEVIPVKGRENEYIARYQPFFSQPDYFIHRNFFPDPWHVALVLDLRCKKDVFFAWGNNTIVQAKGFYLYGE